MEIPVVQLKCESAFNLLSDKEKMYAYYLSKASWEGAKMCLFQCSQVSAYLFMIFQELFRNVKVDDLYNDYDKIEVDKFVEFAALFYSNMGNYNSFGDDKFCPELKEETFKSIIKYGVKSNELLLLLDKYTQLIYSNPKTKLGFPPNEVSGYYCSKITEDEIKLVQEFMELKGWSPYNTRLFKKDSSTYVLKIASAVNTPNKELFTKKLKGAEQLNEIPQETFTYKDIKVIVEYGDFDFIMKEMSNYLEASKTFAANENQVEMLSAYIDSFRHGSLPSHIYGSYVWTQDRNPNVESYIGFIESYRDPLGVRGEFEGFVAVVNKETSKKFNNLVENAPELLKKLPWDKQYEKDVFLKPDFTSLEVISFGSSGVPSGINIPNYDSVRQNYGFKNVALSNVISSKDSNSRISYIMDKDQELFRKYNVPAFEVQVGLHELLGHGSGKLFEECYNNKTYDTVFTDLASSMEECRAELVGMFLCFEKEVLDIFNHNNDDVSYVNWISELRAGLMGLKYYHPESDKWGQAHMQARYVILQVCLETGNGLIEIVEDDNCEDKVYIKLDREKIKKVGIPALGRFLKQLQIYKSTANAEEGREFFKTYSRVNENMLRLRTKIISTSKPRPLMVQCNLYMESNNVKIKNYEPSYKGLIESFIDRYEKDEYKDVEMYDFLTK